MATWHVSYEFGSAGNTGASYAQAKATINQAVALASAGDTIEIWDTFRPTIAGGAAAFNALTFPTLTSTLALTFHFNDFVIRGETDASLLTGWATIDANSFSKTTTTGLYIDAIVHDYDTTATWRVGTNGTLIPNCDLVWVANAATVLTTAYSWYYDSATGLITVNTQGALPRLGLVRGNNRATPYTAGNGTAEYSGLSVDGSNITATGTLTTHNINKYSNTAGYGVFIGESTDVVWQCRSVHHGSGYHGWGAAGPNSKTRISATNLLITTCQRSSTHIVLYASGNDQKVTACDIGGFEIHQLGHLKPDNSLVQAITGQVALFGHTGGPGSYTNNTIAGLRYHDGIIYGYGQASSTAFNVANADPFAGDTFEESERSVVFERVTLVNASGIQISGTMLIKDCLLDFASAGTSGASATGAVIMNSSPIGDVSRNRPLFAGCVIRANLDRAATANFFNHVKGSNSDFTAGDGLAFKNCTIIDQSTQANTVNWFISRLTGATHNSVYARGCAFIVQTKTAASSVFSANDSSLADADLDFKTNAYIGISTTAMSDVVSRNTQAEWTSVIETGTGVLAPLFDTSYANTQVTPGTGEILKTSTLNAGKKPSSFVAKGINMAIFSGAYGAWQINTAPNTRNRQQFRERGAR